LGRKIGKHAADFRLDPANPVHRAQLRHLIAEIHTSPDRVVEGIFRGQGAVKFFIKGDDVVVTTPTEDFVTILKGGVHNPAVRRALQP
jgi:filamentous hemagglutinin